MSDKMIKMARLFRMVVALLAVEAVAATPAIKLRNGVPNAALFARRNVTGNQYFFCLGDSKSTPWVEFARIVAKDLNVKTIPRIYPEPAGACFARYSCVNGQAIYGERVCSGYLAVLDFSATGARGDVKREATYLENLVRAIYSRGREGGGSLRHSHARLDGCEGRGRTFRPSDGVCRRAFQGCGRAGQARAAQASAAVASGCGAASPDRLLRASGGPVRRRMARLATSECPAVAPCHRREAQGREGDADVHGRRSRRFRRGDAAVVGIRRHGRRGCAARGCAAGRREGVPAPYAAFRGT